MNDIQNKKYILIAMILIFTVSGIILNYFLNKKDSVLISQKENIEKKEIQKEEEPAPVIPTPPEKKWKTYVSSDLGFSIKYPEMVYGINRCNSKKPFYVPLKVFEDKENGIVCITEEYYYDDWNSKTQTSTGSCEK